MIKIYFNSQGQGQVKTDTQLASQDIDLNIFQLPWTNQNKYSVKSRCISKYIPVPLDTSKHICSQTNIYHDIFPLSWPSYKQIVLIKSEYIFKHFSTSLSSQTKSISKQKSISFNQVTRFTLNFWNLSHLPYNKVLVP